MKKVSNDKKLNLLSKICYIFNEWGITYMIGGSTMLYLNNRILEFNDIDIMVDENDVIDVIKVLSVLSKDNKEEDTSSDLNKKMTDYHKFIISDIEVEIMSGFIFDKGDRCFHEKFDFNDCDYTTLDGTKIKLSSLKSWRRYYTMMERRFKAKMCEE